MAHLKRFLWIFSLLLKDMNFLLLFVITLQLVLCRVAAVKCLPALIFSADYTLPLVLRDQRIYSEISKIVICSDSFS